MDKNETHNNKNIIKKFWKKHWRKLFLILFIVFLVYYLLLVISARRIDHGGGYISAGNLLQLSKLLETSRLLQRNPGEDYYFLPAYTMDDQRIPLQSWTIFLFQQIWGSELDDYHYNMNVAWNAPQNLPFHEHWSDGVATFYTSSCTINPSHTTTMFTMVVPSGYTPDDKDFVPVIIEDAKSARHWLEPKVLCLEEMFVGLDLDKPSGLGGVHPGKIVMLAADGNVYTISDKTSRRILLMLTTKEGMKKLEKIGKENSSMTEFKIKPEFL